MAVSLSGSATNPNRIDGCNNEWCAVCSAEQIGIGNRRTYRRVRPVPSDRQTKDPSPDVLSLIASRMRGEHDDHRLALALEGGGMRGVVSGAMLIALRDLGIPAVFDRLYGTSSGSVNLAYFAAGGAWDALSIYYDHLTRGFVRKPGLRLKPILNMEYAFDEIMSRIVPLDTDALAASPLDLRMVLADVDDVKPVVVEARKVASEISTYLKAGAWLPVLAGRPFRLGGHRYLDGGVLWPDPLYAAMADGCTHVLVLNTTPENSVAEHRPRMRIVLRNVLNQWSTGLGTAYFASRQRWDADRALIGTGRSINLRGVEVLRVVPPTGSHRVERLTLDRGILLDGARAGYTTIMNTFGRSMPSAYFAIV